MPDFTAIEGGGRGLPAEDFDGQMAGDALRMIAIEILRAIVRGDDSDGRITRNLVKFYDHASKTKINLSQIVNETIQGLHQSLNREHDPELALLSHIDGIINASLRVAAEGCCKDNAAAGRRSSRERELFAAIERFNRWHDR